MGVATFRRRSRSPVDCPIDAPEPLRNPPTVDPCSGRADSSVWKAPDSAPVDKSAAAMRNRMSPAHSIPHEGKSELRVGNRQWPRRVGTSRGDRVLAVCRAYFQDRSGVGVPLAWIDGRSVPERMTQPVASSKSSHDQFISLDGLAAGPCDSGAFILRPLQTRQVQRRSLDESHVRELHAITRRSPSRLRLRAMRASVSGRCSSSQVVEAFHYGRPRGSGHGSGERIRRSPPLFTVTRMQCGPTLHDGPDDQNRRGRSQSCELTAAGSVTAADSAARARPGRATRRPAARCRCATRAR